MKKIKLLPIGLLALVLFNSCSNDDDAVPVNEEEVITTLIATLTPQGGGTTIVLTSRDLDGDGPNPPVINVSGNLSVNKTYSGSLSILNETTSPAEDITEEIEAEADDHQFFFTASNNIGTTAYALPFDSNGKPVGTNFTFTTTAAATGSLTVVLRHLPNKNAENVAAGDITNAGGETDIQVTFPIVVE